MTRGELLVLDSAYSLRTIRERDLRASITARDLDGWFHHVWSVHPLVGADPIDADEAIGPVATHALAPNHTFVEGHVAPNRLLARIPPVAFTVAQLMLVARLARIIRKRPVVAVRAGDPLYLGLLGLVLARIGGVPLVVRINANYDAIYESTGRPAFPRLFRRRSIEKRVERFVLPRAALVVAGNAENLAYAVSNGASSDRTAVFRYGNLVHSVHFGEPGDRPSVAGELDLPARFLICVSRLEPVKRVADLVTVARRVRDRHPDVAVVVVGDGSQRAELESTGALVLPGAQDQRWIASLLAEATVVVAPMMGRALVEAALAGRPIVAYDVDWHGELVADGENGLLVPAGDTSAMADAVVSLLDDPDRADALGAAARASAAARMDPRTLNRLEREAYERVIRPR